MRPTARRKAHDAGDDPGDSPVRAIRARAHGRSPLMAATWHGAAVLLLWTSLAEWDSAIAARLLTPSPYPSSSSSPSSTSSSNPAGHTEWSDCSRGEPPVVVEGVTMLPDPPIIGQRFQLQLPALARAPIDGGYVTVIIRFHGVPVHFEYTDICAQTDCPVRPGNFTFQYARNVPGVAFPGPYLARLMATDSNSSELFCTVITLNVVKGTVVVPGHAPHGVAASGDVDAAAAAAAADAGDSGVKAVVAGSRRPDI